MNRDVTLDAIMVLETQFPREGQCPDLHEGQRHVRLTKYGMNSFGNLCAGHMYSDAHGDRKGSAVTSMFRG